MSDTIYTLSEYTIKERNGLNKHISNLDLQNILCIINDKFEDKLNYRA